MITENQNHAPSLNEIEGAIADADLNNVSGGDKATTTKTTTTTPTTTLPYMVITMREVYISS